MRGHVISVLLTVLLCAPAYAATIGVPENVAPWGLTPDLPPGERGIYADLADAVVKRSKVQIVIKFVPYGRMLEGVRSGELDYAFALVSPFTAATAPFTSIIAKVPMMVVARKGLPLKTMADLHSLAEIGHLRGGSCGVVIESDPAIHRSTQDSYEVAIRKLAAGRLDGLCGIKAGFLYSLARTGMADKIGDQLDYDAFQIGMQVTHTKLNTADASNVSAIVDGLLKDGTVGRIFSQYLGSSYPP
jgi:ABC-type amino acid transport substrate-binding protein